MPQYRHFLNHIRIIKTLPQHTVKLSAKISFQPGSIKLQQLCKCLHITLQRRFKQLFLVVSISTCPQFPHLSPRLKIKNAVTQLSAKQQQPAPKKTETDRQR